MNPQRGIANLTLLVMVVLVSLVIPISRNLVNQGIKLPFAVLEEDGGTDDEPVEPSDDTGGTNNPNQPEEGYPVPPAEEPPADDGGDDGGKENESIASKDCGDRKHKEVWCNAKDQPCICKNTVKTCGGICNYGCEDGECLSNPMPTPKATPSPACVSPKDCMNASYCRSDSIVDPSNCPEGYICCERKVITPYPIKCEFKTGDECDVAVACWTSCQLNDSGCWFCPDRPETDDAADTLPDCQDCVDPSQCEADGTVEGKCDYGLVCCEDRKPILSITPAIYCLGGTFTDEKKCTGSCWDNCRPKGYCWECPPSPVKEPELKVCPSDRRCLDPSQCDPDTLISDTECDLNGLACCVRQPITPEPEKEEEPEITKTCYCRLVWTSFFAQVTHGFLGKEEPIRDECGWVDSNEKPPAGKSESPDSFCSNGRGSGLNKPPAQQVTSAPRPVSLGEQCDYNNPGMCEEGLCIFNPAEGGINRCREVIQDLSECKYSPVYNTTEVHICEEGLQATNETHVCCSNLNADSSGCLSCGGTIAIHESCIQNGECEGFTTGDILCMDADGDGEKECTRVAGLTPSPEPKTPEPAEPSPEPSPAPETPTPSPTSEPDPEKCYCLLALWKKWNRCKSFTDAEMEALGFLGGIWVRQSDLSRCN